MNEIGNLIDELSTARAAIIKSRNIARSNREQLSESAMRHGQGWNPHPKDLALDEAMTKSIGPLDLIIIRLEDVRYRMMDLAKDAYTASPEWTAQDLGLSEVKS